ncbi:MAG: hypothetical protein JW734_07330 [Candidatus Omnitrophica bacterium]|nr:hypothetical protein [Candidatus Omnitrophota bacterium]
MKTAIFLILGLAFFLRASGVCYGWPAEQDSLSTEKFGVMPDTTARASAPVLEILSLQDLEGFSEKEIAQKLLKECSIEESARLISMMDPVKAATIIGGEMLAIDTLAARAIFYQIKEEKRNKIRGDLSPDETKALGRK